MSRRIQALIIVVFSLAVVSYGLVTSGENTIYAVAGVCPTGIDMLNPSVPQVSGGIGTTTVTQQVSNTIPIDISGDPGITSVYTLIDGKIIGKAALIDPNDLGSPWRMMWDTSFSDSGISHSLNARITYGGNNVCNTPPIQITIANPSKKPLDAQLNPSTWVGATNSIAIFKVLYTNPSQALSLEKYAVVNWSTHGIGTISPKDFSMGRFSSGPGIGNGIIRANVIYGGQSITLNSLVEVVPQYSASGSTVDNTTSTGSTSGSAGSPTTTTTVTNPDGSTTTTNPNGSTTVINPDGSTTTTNPVDGTSSIPPANGGNATPVEGGTSPRLVHIEPAKAIQRVLNSDPTIQACITDKLGADGTDTLVKANRRPNSSEFKKYIQCFDRYNYVIPNILSPVSPENVKTARVSKDISISGIVNAKKSISQDGIEKTTLELSGIAEPNSNIVLYVFSEPLVLATTTDSDGNWSYSLEDPLVSGGHEVMPLLIKATVSISAQA